MIAAERAKVLLVRSKGRLASEVVSEVLGMLDIEESMLDAGTEARASVRNTSMAFTAGRVCDDLAEQPAIETVADPACASCLADGTRWVSLRQCLTCDHVGCCDSSVGRHATVTSTTRSTRSCSPPSRTSSGAVLRPQPHRLTSSRVSTDVLVGETA